MYDSHVHANFSTDSKMKIEEIITKSKESSINFVVTEHMDINYPSEVKFKFNPYDYFKTFGKYRSNALLLGVEIGMEPDLCKENSEFVQPYPFDMVIGSVHLLDGYDLYEKDIYGIYPKKELYIKYLTYMKDCLKTHGFINTLGHIDYITRYATYEDRELRYEEFSDYIDEILKQLINDEIAFEINTRRFNNIEAKDNYINILKRYKDLGGEYITIGSDAHVKGNLANNLQYASTMAEALGLTEVYFKAGNMEKVKRI